MGCEQGFLRKILDSIIEGFCERLDERAAAGGAGLIEQDVVDCVVFDADALHVLSADVEDAVYLGIKESGGIIVGNGLYFTLVQKESRLEQGFTVAGGTAAYDLCICREQAVDFRHRRNSSPDRAAVIVAVKRVEERAVFSDESELGCRRTCVDPEEAFSVIVGKIRTLHLCLLVAAAESVIFLL